VDGKPLETATKIRRAILLRGKLASWYPGLFNGSTIASIDPSVVQAFLEVKQYNHGTRSLEAVLRMSDLSASAAHFPRSALPGDDQLALHVDVDSFRTLLSR